MQIRKTNYKNIPAIELTTEKYAVLMLPDEGGKMASFRDRNTGKEYLVQNPSESYLPLGLEGEYEFCECSGFDDMFPTIDPVSVKNSLGQELSYPDHGEICRLPFGVCVSDGALTLSCDSPLLGVHYEKTLTEGEDGAVQIHYTITNPTAADLDVLWAAHCLVNAQPGGQVLTPFSEGHLVDVLNDSLGVIAAGTRMPSCDEFLRTPIQAHPPKSAKLYFSGMCTQGFMGYRYPDGDAFVMAFDCKELPSLGLWVNNGRLNGWCCVGLEPCTVGYDTVVKAKQYGQENILKAGEKMEFTLTLYTTQT